MADDGGHRGSHCRAQRSSIHRKPLWNLHFEARCDGCTEPVRHSRHRVSCAAGNAFSSATNPSQGECPAVIGSVLEHQTLGPVLDGGNAALRASTICCASAGRSLKRTTTSQGLNDDRHTTIGVRFVFVLSRMA